MTDHFVITIGRQFGSGGRELGRTLSEKLGIPFYDKELLLQAANSAGVNPELMVNTDERAPKFFNGIFPFNYGVSPLPWYSGASSITDDGLYRVQSDFIHNLASQGSCIIVGRSADYVLRDMPNVVNVFINADIDDCVKRIISRSDCADETKARRMAEKMNKLRANYYNFYTDKRWGDAASYDLCFNSSKLPIADIADIIIEYINRRKG